MDSPSSPNAGLSQRGGKGRSNLLACKPAQFPLSERLRFYADGRYQALQVTLPHYTVEHLRRGVYYALRKAEEVGWPEVQLIWLQPPAPPTKRTSGKRWPK